MKCLKNDKKDFLVAQRSVEKFIKSSFHMKEAGEGKHRLNLRLLALTSMLGSGKVGAPVAW